MMQKYHELYCKDANNSIRVWHMDQDGPRYRTISGVHQGQLVTSEWTLATPKNEGKKNATTAEEQAKVEIEAKYKKQLKTGYHKDIKDIDKAQYFEPMLAKNFEDYKDKIDWSKGVVVQIKYNGSRCIATKNGLFTRKGERYLTLPHIEKELAPFFQAFPNAVLDGEAFNYELREQLNELMKLVRKSKNITKEDLDASADKVKFYIYDGVFDSKSGGYIDRKTDVDMTIKTYSKNDILRQVQTWEVNSEKELEKLYQSFLKDGHEGAMIRLLDYKYENKRSKSLLKYKPVDDSEATILHVLEGNGNWSGAAKTATLSWKGKEFDATFKGEREELVKILLDKKKWVGKTVTFLYNGLTGLGTPNFARIDISNCFKS